MKKQQIIYIIFILIFVGASIFLVTQKNDFPAVQSSSNSIESLIRDPAIEPNSGMIKLQEVEEEKSTKNIPETEEKSSIMTVEEIQANPEKFGEVKYDIQGDLELRIIITDYNYILNKKFPNTDGIRLLKEAGFFLLKNNRLIQEERVTSFSQGGFIGDKYFYITYSKEGKEEKWSLNLNNEIITVSSLLNDDINTSDEEKSSIITTQNGAIVTRDNGAYKMILPDGSELDGYSIYYDSGLLEDGTKIALVGKGIINNGMTRSLQQGGEYILLVDGIENIISSVKKNTNPEFSGIRPILYTCGNNYGYKMSDGYYFNNEILTEFIGEYSIDEVTCLPVVE